MIMCQKLVKKDQTKYTLVNGIPEMDKSCQLLYLRLNKYFNISEKKIEFAI